MFSFVFCFIFFSSLVEKKRIWGRVSGQGNTKKMDTNKLINEDQEALNLRSKSYWPKTWPLVHLLRWSNNIFYLVHERNKIIQTTCFFFFSVLVEKKDMGEGGCSKQHKGRWTSNELINEDQRDLNPRSKCYWPKTWQLDHLPCWSNNIF